MSDAAVAQIKVWLDRCLTTEQMEWLDGQLDKIVAEPTPRNIQIAFGLVPRKLGKTDLGLSESELQAALEVRPGWCPQYWSVDVAARVLILVSAGTATNNFAEQFISLCRLADVAEAVALYNGLPLYPEPAKLETQAGEGLRTNMRSVFEAIAHNNPFPREQFDENRWNHMVLKALFVDSSLYPIQGVDDRANPELARILSDYAHERWAASRPVTPELWRCVGPFAEGALLQDLERVISEGGNLEKQAAALALRASPAPEAKDLLARIPAEAAAAAEGQITWDSIGQAHAQQA